MRHPAAVGAFFVVGVAVGAVAVQSVHAQAHPYVTTQILRAGLNNLAGQEILVFTSTWQPGFRLPLHMHPNGHEITYVIEGEQTFEIEGVGTKVVHAGEAIYTPPNTAHFGRNATDKPSTTLVDRVKDRDEPVMVEIKR